MKSFSRQSGFTLLELVASLGVFSVVIIIFSSTFLALLNAERRAQAGAAVEDNLRFAVEVMAKEVRTGTNYVVQTPNTSITFTNSGGDTVQYRLSGDDILPNPCSANPCIGKVVTKQGITSPFLPLTSGEITIDGIRFFLAGIQPRITIAVSAHAKVQNIETPLHVQTTISQRKVAVP